MRITHLLTIGYSHELAERAGLTCACGAASPTGLGRLVEQGSKTHTLSQNKKAPLRGFFCFGGEGGIRTRGTVLAHTRFPSERLKPLSHLSTFFQFPHNTTGGIDSNRFKAILTLKGAFGVLNANPFCDSNRFKAILTLKGAFGVLIGCADWSNPRYGISAHSL